MKQLVNRLSSDFPNISFEQGNTYRWSPKNATVIYNPDEPHKHHEVTLLHELSHALLQHTTFHTDFELLLMEVSAWEKAQEIGRIYNIAIPDDHIQNCLDTYRDWLHMRSTCPRCAVNGLQDAHRKYKCPNCSNTWRVSSSRLCRPYRKNIRK